MLKDVLALAAGKRPDKIPSKETTNHPGLLYLASGINPYENTQAAYLKTYENVGIDIINRVPEHNAPTPLKPGETKWLDDRTMLTYFGVYDSKCKMRFPYADEDDLFEEEDIQLDYDALNVPVPHKLDAEMIRRKSGIVGDIGLYYYQYYTTLFMWGVEYLGWDIFMRAAATEPEWFEENFIRRAFETTCRDIRTICEADNPFVFLHDDLADARGPVFHPVWYEKYIYPYYEKMFQMIKSYGKKIIFVADGNMTHFLKDLRVLGVDGIMFENPATSLEAQIEAFGDRIIIGGIETKKLMQDTPENIKKHVFEVCKQFEGINGYVMSTPGGLVGGIPIENVVAYVDARAALGIAKEDWKIGNVEVAKKM